MPTRQGSTGTDWEATGARRCCRWEAHLGGGSGSIPPPPRPPGARWSAPLISPYLPKPLANVTLMELKSTRFVLLQLSPNPPTPPPPPRFPLFWK